MRTFQFKYIRLGPDSALRPALLTTISHAGKHMRCMSLLDSGADVCAYPLEFAKLLGVDILNSGISMTTGLGGQRASHIADIKIGICEMQFPVKAGFNDGLNQFGFGILGQSGFFDRFRVVFDRSGGSFEITAPMDVITIPEHF